MLFFKPCKKYITLGSYTRIYEIYIVLLGSNISLRTIKQDWTIEKKTSRDKMSTSQHFTTQPLSHHPVLILPSLLFCLLQHVLGGLAVFLLSVVHHPPQYHVCLQDIFRTTGMNLFKITFKLTYPTLSNWLDLGVRMFSCRFIFLHFMFFHWLLLVCNIF